MSRSSLPERPLRLAAIGDGRPTPEERSRALEEARDCTLRAPAVLGARPWRLELKPDRLVLRIDRTRQPSGLDPTGRLLLESAGTALCAACVVLAARGWATRVDRLPRPDDPDLLAEVRPVRSAPDSGQAAFEPGLQRRPTGRPRSADGQLTVQVLRRLAASAEGNGVLLVPVVHDAHRRLVARLIQQAGSAVDDAGPWTTVLLATRADDEHAWLRTGEALQRILLALARLDRPAVLFPQATEVPLARVQLRAALAWDAHPQLLVRIGSAGRTR